LPREKAEPDIDRVTAPQTHIHLHVRGVVWTRTPNSTFVYIYDFLILACRLIQFDLPC